MSGSSVIRIGPSLRGRRVAVVHRRGGQWSVVVAEVGDSVRVIASETVRFGDAGGARQVIERHRAERVVRVAPGAATIVRAVELPAGNEGELESAAALMAEAEMPPIVSEWRRGWGASPLGASDGHAALLLIGWVGEAGEAALGFNEETWTSEVVGAAWLASLGEDGVCASGDREVGSIVVAAAAGGHGLIRTVREEGAGPAAWAEAAGEVASEMGVALNAGAAGDRFVVVDDGAGEAIARMGGKRSSEWIATHGIGLGVLLGMARGGAGALFALHANEPQRRVGRLERIAAWMSGPGRAATIVGVCLVLLIAAPVVFAMARERVLGARVKAIEQGMGGSDELERRGTFYKTLESKRWPMTKLMADVAGLLPVGVQLETISMTVGDQITIRGVDEEGKKLNAFTTALNESGVFSAGAPDVRRTEKGYEFDLRVRVVSAFAKAKGAEDFGATSLGARLYGEAYSEVEAREAAEAADREKEREERAARRRGSGATFDGGEGRTEEAEPVPDPLTDEAIAAMDRSAVMKEFASRNKASSRRDIEEDVRQRLKDEVEKLRGKLREMKGGS